MVKTVNLAFCSIKQLFIRDIRARLGIPNLPVSRYSTKLRRGYFQFPDFLWNLLYTKLAITPQPVSILIWNLNELLKLTRKTRWRQKKLKVTSSRQFITSSSFFLFMLDLEQSRTWIPERGLWFLHFHW